MNEHRIHLSAMRSQSGQVVIMLLLVMVIVLTIGLSIAARSTVDVNISTLNEQSARAFAAAEAGLEEALRDPSNAQLQTGLTRSLGEAKFKVLQIAQTGPLFAFPGGVPRDDPAQVWLSNYPDLTDTSMTNKTIRVFWGGSSAAYECTATSALKTPALEYVSLFESSGAYTNTHGFYDPCGTQRIGASGFTIPETGQYELTTNLGKQTYKYRTPDITLSGNPKLLRIRLLHNEAPAPVAVQVTTPGVNLPAQGTLLESTGEFGEARRKVQIFRSYPRLPGIFDYVLFAGGTITK